MIGIVHASEFFCASTANSEDVQSLPLSRLDSTVMVLPYFMLASSDASLMSIRVYINGEMREPRKDMVYLFARTQEVPEVLFWLRKACIVPTMSS